MPVLMKRVPGGEGLRNPLRNVAMKTSAPVRNDISDFLQTTRPASGLLSQCGNAKCRSGWMKLWRSRQSPVLEGKWACSQVCMQELVRAAVLREAGEADLPQGTHQHRIPLGLVLLSRGMITQQQLRRALEAQRTAGTGRLGEWLVRQNAVEEDQVTRALSMQWNCPVLTSKGHDPAAMAAVFPRLLVDSFGGIALRLAGRELLYVAFEDKIDRCLVLAAERMLGLKVEAGVLQGSEFRRVQQEILRAGFPKTRLLEAANMRGVVHAFAAFLEERKAVRAQVVRIHDYFWLRIWRSLDTNPQQFLREVEDVEDMLCFLAASERSQRS